MNRPISRDDAAFAKAIVSVIGESKWEGVGLAKAFIALENRADNETAARAIYEAGPHSLKHSRELIPLIKRSGFISLLTAREKKGSAENPVTKLIPATVTEERFIEALDELKDHRRGLSYKDERQTDNKLIDFTIEENGQELPINVKNAGTRFERAQDLVGLDPNDCVPIPAYKANAAVEAVPELLYVVSVDYSLVATLNQILPTLFAPEESKVWTLLNDYAGPQIRSGEDAFIFRTVRKHWHEIKPAVAQTPFAVISARKALTILHENPKRTPGIGLRAWGTGASAEVNVHVSIADDMKPWPEVSDRIINNGIDDIIRAVNRRVMREVPAPEI